MENVRTSACASHIHATTKLESTPPDRKAPTGTSATRRLVTASRTVVSRSAGLAGKAAGSSVSSVQNSRTGEQTPESRSTCTQEAGDNFSICSKIDAGAGTY